MSEAEFPVVSYPDRVPKAQQGVTAKVTGHAVNLKATSGLASAGAGGYCNPTLKPLEVRDDQLNPMQRAYRDTLKPNLPVEDLEEVEAT
jgi:hypothetical protein